MADVVHSNELPDDESDFGHLRPGKRLGRYELLVPIARGGMARVWAARQHGQRGFQKLVAIKTILPSLAEEPEFERMFLDEARIASGVHHPNVCEIYELGEEKRTLYLAMEWVNGESFSRVLRPSGQVTEAIDPRVAARIVADACAGAHAAHELTDEDGRPLGVVHRDLSPHNILLSADGHTKVCDFGVAKALGQLHEETSTGQLKGKLSYMSAEQLTKGIVDRRSDVFSLGCVLYEATTGVRPFRGDRDYLVMKAIVDGDIEAPSKIVRGYPMELERIVLRALANKPLLRFPTAEKMRIALEEYLAHGGSIVTHSNVAQIIRARLGEQLDKRRESIKQASSQEEQAAWDPAQGRAERGREPPDQRSGVKPSRPNIEVRDNAVAGMLGDMSTVQGAFTGDVHDTVTGHFEPPDTADDPPRPPSPPSGTTQTMPLAPVLPPVAAAPTSVALPKVPPADATPAPASPVQYAMAALAGVLLAVIIGGGGYTYWRSHRVERAPAPAAAPADPVVETATARTAAPAPSPLVFQTIPPDAVLVVDGVELPVEARTLQRPTAGRIVTVVGRAKGYDDASVIVDYFTATPVTLTLKPSLARAPAASEAAPAPAASPTTKPKRPKAGPVLPDNPY